MAHSDGSQFPPAGAANPGASGVVVIGAGPAGLTAAHLLAREGVPVTVLERHPSLVGGLSRTERRGGFLFDIGGHRFFSKSAEVNALWREFLGADLISRNRKSRIRYREKLFDYPLRPVNALSKLGLAESTACVLSYLRAQAFPTPHPRNFEEWVVNRFGRRLFEIFFKTYTEKVWGMACTEISADWAAQRIKDLSLGAVIRNAVRPRRRSAPQAVIKTLIDRFDYPRRGPGMMWEAVAARVTSAGGRLLMGMEAVHLAYDPAGPGWTVRARDAGGAEHDFAARHVISSAALRDLVGALAPAPDDSVLRAANALRYRDFMIVALVVRDRDMFDDNWIYIHDPGVKVGRIQNFKSWSPEMVSEPGLNCYGMEYFCTAGDAMWDGTDEDAIALARNELVGLGLAKADDILDGHVLRQEKAYPVYDEAYGRHVRTIRDALATRYPGLHPVGRNGMHRYNNQDHAMMTAMLTVRNILAGRPLYDVWRVGQDAEYIEEDGMSSPLVDSRLVPVPAGQTAAGGLGVHADK